jgi:hypothetical protein
LSFTRFWATIDPIELAVGVLLALAKAEQLDYSSLKSGDTRGLQMWRKAKGICLEIERGRDLPTHGEWLAGYYFNDGIIRIAVAYEHIVRHVTKLHGKELFRRLKKEAIREGLKTEWASSWELVHKEVNRLKHQNLKFVDGPLLKYNQALQALDHLVYALKWGTKRGKG